MSLSLADAKKVWFQAAVGYPGAPSTEEDITTLEWLFYSANSGLTPIEEYSVTDHKRQFLITKTALPNPQRSTTDGIERYWIITTNGVNTYASLDDVRLDFYTNHPYTGI